MKKLMNMLSNESGHAYGGYGYSIGGILLVVLLVLLLLWLL